MLSKSQILQNVWRYDFGGNANVVETYVSYLRRKLDAAGPPLIKTVRQVGLHARSGVLMLGRLSLRARLVLGVIAGLATVGLVAADVATYSSLQLVPDRAHRQPLDETASLARGRATSVEHGSAPPGTGRSRCARSTATTS